ncbi:MAG TPA: T9SS type A sorting domain-containing protein, partial [Candidatus Syntrophosphaera sp.]|nr:T9SS type A sorting domain-containing protein [Candidatus Syntrophosphaera sp.]
APLAGASDARVKVEWFNSDGGLIDLETHTVATAASILDQYLDFDLLSSPAPAGSAAMRLVLTILQGQGAPPSDVFYDQITCYSTTFPTIDDVQWDDFPSGRTLQFANRTWRVKGTGFYGPGPNNFSHLPESVWVDASDRLHLTIRQFDSAWHSTEVTLADTLGYGDYVFTTLGSLDQLDPRAVLGLFLWQYLPCWDPGNAWWNPYNEIDVEYSRWGNPANEIGQFVVQPWDWAGNISRYDAVFGAQQLASHAFRWLPGSVEFRSWYGGPDDENPGNMISQWDYFGPHIPRPEQPRVHMNLWYTGAPPTTPQEIVISAFSFIPANGNSHTSDEAAAAAPVLLGQNCPNPFHGTTSISFLLKDPAPVTLAIFDLRGRKLATLAEGQKQPGQHAAQWDAGTYPSGVYLYRLQSGGVSVTRKMVLLRPGK